jgi:hypothetical protein
MSYINISVYKLTLRVLPEVSVSSPDYFYFSISAADMFKCQVSHHDV